MSSFVGQAKILSSDQIFNISSASKSVFEFVLVHRLFLPRLNYKMCIDSLNFLINIRFR